MPTINGHEMAREVEHCRFADLGTYKVEEGKDESAAEIMATIDAYLHGFCKPVREGEGDLTHTVCPKCGERQSGFAAMLGIGVGLEWGLIHGEASCTNCHWPYRALHRIRDKDHKEGDEPLLTISNLFLAYHPDVIEVRRTRDKVKDALAGRG